MLKIMPCKDSEEMAIARKKELSIPRNIAAELGQKTVLILNEGYYISKKGKKVVLSHYVQKARSNKISIPPDAPLPEPTSKFFPETIVQVTNETTLAVAKQLTDNGQRVLALNFADGVFPCGFFLSGARAQEENLCRSSALYVTLLGDPMYKAHSKRPLPDSTDWAIYSPDVPVFRSDDGSLLEEPWLLSFITCAAPVAQIVGRTRSAELLKRRIHRVLAIAKAYEYTSLVLGAWGCGAFRNDPYQTAKDFREVLETDFNGVFSTVIFAIADSSLERRFLGPFCKVFSPNGEDK